MHSTLHVPSTVLAFSIMNSLNPHTYEIAAIIILIIQIRKLRHTVLSN